MAKNECRSLSRTIASSLPDGGAAWIMGDYFTRQDLWMMVVPIHSRLRSQRLRSLHDDRQTGVDLE